MDIKGAFDNIRWPILINNLKQSPCPAYLVNWVVSFLQHRYVSLEENGIKVTKRTFGGCPQGSCLGPLLWLLIAETAFKKYWGTHARIQAFADVFIVVLKGKSVGKLKRLANRILKKFNKWIKDNSLTLNTEKTELLFLNRGFKGNLPTQNTNVLEGIELEGQALSVREQI